MQHIRDFLNNRHTKNEEKPPAVDSEPPSPGRSPSHAGARRLNSGESGQYTRPH